MAKGKRVQKPVTVTTVIEESQHEALRYIAYKERTPMAELVRQALDEMIRRQAKKYPIHTAKAV